VASVATERTSPPPARRGRVAEAAFLLLVLVLTGGALAGDLGRFGGRDWDQFEADLVSARRAVLADGELPFWMPYRVGGHDAFADPQSLWLSPLGLLVLALGVPVGIRAFLALAAAVAAAGVLRLGRRLGLGPPGRLLAAALVGLGPPLALYAAGGIPTFTLGLALLPWVVLGLLRGTAGGAVAAGLLLALDLYGGDVNHFVFHGLFAALLLGAWAVLARSWRPLLAGALAAAVAGAAAAPKLAPALALTRRTPREVGERGRGAMTLALFGHAFLDRAATRAVEAPYGEFLVLTRDGRLAQGVDPAEALPHTAVDWVHTGSYVGPLAAALALAGAFVLVAGGGGARAPPRLARGPLAALLVAALVMAWLACGANATPSGWLALRGLPLFGSLRSPERLVLYPYLGLVLLAGAGLDLLLGRLRARAPGGARFVAATVLVAVGLDVHLAARSAYAAAFVEPGPRAASAGPFVSVAGRRPPGSTYYGVPVAPHALAGRSVTNGYTAVPTAGGAVPSGHPAYRGEAFLAGGRGDLGHVAVTARRLTVEADLEALDTLVWNQNHAPGWTAVAPAGARARRRGPDDPRLAVDLEPGARRVELVYTPPGLGWGLLVALLGLPGLGAAAWRLRGALGATPPGAPRRS